MNFLQDQSDTKSNLKNEIERKYMIARLFHQTDIGIH